MDAPASSVRTPGDVAMADLPVPWGWFAVAFSHELQSGSVLSRRLAGEDLAIWRSADGSIAAIRSTCPHLGADLRLGRVDGDVLRCPFHRFAFDASGACIATGTAAAPPAGVCVRSWPACERNGVILLWHHPTGSPPTFDVPALAAEPMTALDRTTTRCFVLAGHPVATSENSVDLSHLAVVHHYRDVAVIEPFGHDGCEATVSYEMTRPIGVPGDDRVPALRRITTAVRFDVRLFGLGVSLVEAYVPAIGARTRQWVLATPTEPGRIELRIAMQVLHAGGRLRRVAEHVGVRLAAGGFAHDVRQDLPVWSSQRYVVRPALAHGDGPIAPYRRWAAQFLETGG